MANFSENRVESVMPQGRLADVTTFQLGGPCRRLVTCRTPEQAQAALVALIEAGTPYVLIGGGSNLLVADAGVDCVVVRFFTDEPLIERDGDLVEVSGATILDQLVRYAVAQGLDGLTYCSGIPGTVGGAIVGNAGAFGRQIGDVLESVWLMNTRGETYRRTPAELAFAYRRSALQQNGEVVLSARLRLSLTDRAVLEKERGDLMALRRAKHPDWKLEPCIGSIFRNIEPSSAAGRRQAAGWYLETAGAKELRVGGAYVYPRHANIIIKGEDGTAEDVYRLCDQMAECVRRTFDFELEREVRFLGAFKAAGAATTNGHHFF